ncbi:hypothetical protein HOLleu_39331 [Holothuria leucospilota]|uniref:BRICHOS domain-containing protein n=1 Tax=Holothuria leucospilota TaxID=206669 RepID=A0A9Q0YN76_HOLLE|nr:hypothetical protein HOLleu_39331 [Holothuria leucospilota]
MDLDRQPKGDFNMGIEQQSTFRGRDNTKWYVFAITVFAVALVAGFMGVFYILLSAPTPTVINNVSSDVEEHEGDLQVVTRGVSFDMNGEDHYETMSAEGQVLSVQNYDDGFTGIFDYSRNILMIKNLTSNVCFFTRLEGMPDMGINDMDNARPFFFQQVSPGYEDPGSDPNVETMILSQSAVIPPGYVMLTNDVIVSSQCTEQPSYWLEPKDGTMVRRQDSEVHIRAIVFCIHIEIYISW